MPANHPLFDVNPKLHPEQFQEAVQRTKAFVLGAPDDLLEEGINWYPSVNDATHTGARDLGISTAHGAGIVAAVSPSMDFESNNINAFGEISGLNPTEKAMVRESARISRENKTFNRLLSESHRLRGESVPTNLLRRTGRLPEVSSMLTERAPSIAPANDSNIVKALDILEGGDPEVILSRRTAPKTNSFYRNIAGDVSVATIDGRESDMTANRMRPWEIGRGIDSAALPSGKRTRYEDHEDVLRAAMSDINKSSRIRHFTEGRGITLPGVQAVKWVVGKRIERTNPDGTMRKIGPARKGQPYI
jgi:hypothetical protein